MAANVLQCAPPGESERELVQEIWMASQETDAPAFRPRVQLSVHEWSNASCLLRQGGDSIGVAAIAVRRGEGLAEGRLALLPSSRSPEAAKAVVEAAMRLAREAGVSRLRLSIWAAGWAREAAQGAGFDLLRSIYLMLRPAEAPALGVRMPEGLTLRTIGENEDDRVLAALNRAWEGTWNFRPIQPSALASDLAGQREGFLLAVDQSDETRIAGTVHAMFNAAQRNPDGAPYAWISNLTTDPDYRGRGLGRALLAAGLESLHARGARSVALGVDGGNIVPVSLYRSVGFEAISTQELWEREI